MRTSLVAIWPPVVISSLLAICSQIATWFLFAEERSDHG